MAAEQLTKHDTFLSMVLYHITGSLKVTETYYRYQVNNCKERFRMSRRETALCCKRQIL